MNASSAKKREIVALEDQYVQSPHQPQTTRWIDFGSLIEHGLLEPGAVLCDRDRRHHARLTRDGFLVSDDRRGTIHQMAARCMNAPIWDGWHFWHVQTEDGFLVSIDLLRRQLRMRLN